MLSSIQQSAFDSGIFSLWVLLLLEIIGLKGNHAEANSHLETGRRLLAQGQLQDALTHIHTAIETEPKNYLAYFTRATIYLGLGKAKAATSDLSEVLKMKPDFTAARLQRGSTLLKQGNLDEAHIDIESVLRIDPSNEEANRLYTLIEPLRSNIVVAGDMLKQSNYEHAIHYLNEAIEVCPWNPDLREMRADCYIQLGDIRQAIADLKPVTRMSSDNTQGHYKISNLHYRLGDVEESLNDIRECLKLDPDHKDCYPFYKAIKKLSKVWSNMKKYHQDGSFEDCIQSAEKLLNLEPNVPMIKFQAYDKLCYCHQKIGQTSKSVSACSDALAISEEPRLYCDRAEAYLANDQFDEAINDYQKALNVDGEFSRAKEGIQRAQKLLKQSKKRDYYKILGVKRNAKKQEIIKAYRKLAQKWHPDNFSGDEKKTAENKFIDIASAKEVLTDPEKREKYDNGEDPLDPESQQGQGFNPFQHFQQFQQGGGPFQFKFHFN